jgi:hypothetical protein
MSQYKISKARLAQIIKEEYQSLHEDNALTRNINRWSEEGKDIPKHLTVGRMGGDRVSLHRLQGMIHSLQDDFIPYLDGTEEHEMYELVNDLLRQIKSRIGQLSPGRSMHGDRVMARDFQHNRDDGAGNRKHFQGGSDGMANRNDEALTGDQKEMDEDDDGDIDEDDLAAKRDKKKVKNETTGRIYPRPVLSRANRDDDLPRSKRRKKKVKKESLDSIRDLIQQELQNL